jgi:hypothetical protein
MGAKDVQTKQSNNQIVVPTVNDKKNDLDHINETFKISKVVNQLHEMMSEVTKEGYEAKNVNAACNCISQLNQVINTTISAARFLRE